ncbi:MAG: hypothetical protein JHC60_00275 [Sphingobium sp.]|uniref:hypothetical protein n=1 Tax=Sphingobium cupriresistens TaxID=1132417 RepID=UPI001A2406B1|nr:hypothetical protein [Sphingobium sp.]
MPHASTNSEYRPAVYRRAGEGGFMRKCPTCRIFAGMSELMKIVIAKDMPG